MVFEGRNLGQLLERKMEKALGIADSSSCGHRHSDDYMVK